ncbi:MAG: hypothetical protein Q9210_002775 [Variospora velana]
MASRLAAKRKPRASRQSDQGTLRSPTYSAAIRLDPFTAKWHQGIEREQPRRSARLEGISRLTKSIEDRNPPKQASPIPPAGKSLNGRVALQPLQVLHNPPKLHQKRKREAGHSSPEDQDRFPSKQPRTSPPSYKTEAETQKEAESDTSKSNADPVETWIHTKKWPSHYFRQDSQVREDFEHDSWLEELMEESNQVVQYVEINGARYPRPIRKLPTSLRRKQSDSSLNSSSHQKSRESKSAQYRDARYTTLLAAKGSYMSGFRQHDIPTSTKDLCRTLLATDQIVPQDSFFRDDLFTKTCSKLEDRNEAMIIQKIGRLIVASAEDLATYGATNLDHLIESFNEGWMGSIPVEGPRPQPDYSLGFRRSAFTDEQLNKLDPLVGSVFDTSFFVATYRMYFPFLTCEVKCGAAALDVADRQNAHSMTIAVRGIVELYKAVKREKELHREILAFSISHDHSSVRIYGHYAIIEENKTTFYRHPIHRFDFTALDGKDKWTAYKFSKNVYDVWMPTHLKRICSVIDQLPPNLNFEVSQGSELQFTEASGLSEELGGLLSEQSSAECASLASQDDSELAPIIPQTVTPDTSVSQREEGATLKRPKRKYTTK